MAEFTGITAARAEEILGDCIVSGAVNEAGHIIFTRVNGETIDGGDFSGIVSDVVTAEVGPAVEAATADIPDMIAGEVFDLGNITGAIPFTGIDNVELVNAMLRLTATGNLTLNSADLPASPKPNTQFAIRITQDATGGRTLTLTGFKKSLGVLTLSTGANDIDILMFLYDGVNWFAGMMGTDFS